MNNYMKLIYIMTGVIILNVAFLFLYLLPNKNEIDNWSTKIIRLQNRIHELSRDSRETEKRLKALDKTGSQLSKFKNEILGNRTEKIREIMARLDTLAARFRLEKGRVTYTPTQYRSDQFEKLRIQFTVKGDYNGIRYFINMLERDDLFLIFERLALTSGSKSEEIQLNVALSTYFLKREKS